MMNMKLITILTTFLIAANLFAEDLIVKIDPHMSNERQKILYETINKANSLEIDVEKVSPNFKSFFGDSGKITNYLNERVFYIVDDKSDGSYVRPFLNGEALNLGTALYFSALSMGYRGNTWGHNGKLISINSPRVGIIQLNSDFFSEHKHVLERLSTLIHEARHSDCEIVEDIPAESCGYPHINKNRVDKDKYLHGAYEMSYMFGDAIANACINCSDEDKFVGLIIWSSEQSKINNKNH
jgi:hypothetical protein